MSILNRAAGVAIAAAVGLSAVGAEAQTAKSPVELCKGGQLAVVRMNAVKPGAKAAYEKAARDHLAWYRSHGYAQNRLMVGPVITGDRANGYTASETEFASIHMDSPGVPPDKRDAGWDAYVKAYRDSSDLTVDKFVCLREPK
ncbi:hypothetical protein [Phenylobacterium kunshanense]|uniref:DUF1330 domain-containing protein n=1 Tax=Phenylobacterium kunshanense TaxID=1445034 RepID=A0A328BP25_9CAUL|nr:hypothetical protein [Phenylobacterium kunshanense]RAK69092.1 hypothetical protein DJ019_03545 [Phenylobacterium kunshanense]